MNRKLHLKSFIIVCCTVAICGLVQAQTVSPDFVDGQVHLKISTNPGFDLENYTGGDLALDFVYNTYDVDSIYKPFPMPTSSLDSIYRVVFSSISAVDALISALELLPFVEFAEKNPMAQLFFTPNDLQSNQWSLSKIDAELGWNTTTGSASVLVAVLDNAIAIDHQDLAANIYINAAETGGLGFLDDDGNGYADDFNGYDVVDRDNNPKPPAGSTGNGDGFIHGTHVSGLIGAVSNNGVGMASIGYQCKILPVKIASDANGSALSGALDGIFYAMRSGADIINMSWGIGSDNVTLRMLIEQVASSGIVMIAAAGNDGNQNLHYPAAYPETISVGATNSADQIASFSNRGTTIDLMAPGQDVYSTLTEGNNTYGNLSGTSMATPITAGLASLVKAQFPSFNAQQIKQRLLQGCENIDAENPGLSGQIGSGRINAFQTLGNVSISEAKNHSITVLSNPITNGVLAIKTDGNHSLNKAVITVLDATGRIVINELWKTNIDVSFLVSGIYLVNVETTTFNYSTKLMLQ
ncbi:MAG: serine protease [Psychroserpens sp.]|jgi:serine protease